MSCNFLYAQKAVCSLPFLPLLQESSWLSKLQETFYCLHTFTLKKSDKKINSVSCWHFVMLQTQIAFCWMLLGYSVIDKYKVVHNCEMEAMWLMTTHFYKKPEKCGMYIYFFQFHGQSHFFSTVIDVSFWGYASTNLPQLDTDMLPIYLCITTKVHSDWMECMFDFYFNFQVWPHIYNWSTVRT